MGYPVVAPSENGDAPVHTFFGGCFFTAEHSVGSDCPDGEGNTEDPEQ